MPSRRPDGKQLTWAETLGAWLGLWTPPRGVDVPPVPWRRVVAVAAGIAIILGAAAAVVVPRITEAQRSVASRERDQAAKRRADFLANVDREQTPRHGRGPTDPIRDPRGERVEARTELLTSARAALAADAKQRGDDTIRGTDCEPFPKSLTSALPVEQLSRPAAAYQCVAVTARFGQGEDRSGVIGTPYRLVVRFTEGTFAFCRVVPLSDRDRLSHPLPSACRV